MEAATGAAQVANGMISAAELIEDAKRLKKQRAEIVEDQANNRELLRLLARTGKLTPEQEAEVEELFKRGDG